jgi:NADH dehydrogenase
MTDRHRVVVVGGGFGGLHTVHGLNGPGFEVTLVDRTNHHLFQPLLYQVATGILPPGLIAPALRSAVRAETNVRTLLADVDDIDLEGRTVHAHGLDTRPRAMLGT